MSIKKEKEQAVFNSLILSNLIMEEGYESFGYITIKDHKLINHINYYSPKVFNKFVSSMKNTNSDAFNKYSKGSGQELTSTASAPPKMACVSSSSRFCYTALGSNTMAFNSTSKADFEYRCPIYGVRNATANLDAYISRTNDNVYIEAKCQEIFDDHKLKMKLAYWDCMFDKNIAIGFHLPQSQPKPSNRTIEFDIPLDQNGFNLSINRFDFKQFLCHLLGIASQNNDKHSILCYMFYKPLSDSQNENDAINNIFNDLATEINAIFSNDYIKKFCLANHISLMAIYEESKIMKPLTTSNMKILVPKYY